MLRSSTKVRGALVALAAAALAAPLAAPAHAASGDVSEPIVTGLSGPLGLAVAPDGTVYVAQAFGDPENGVPSTLDRVEDDGTLTTVASSMDGEIAGPDAMSPGNGRAKLTYVTTGGNEQGPFAGLRWVRPSGRLSKVADLLAHEENENPDGDVHYGFSDLPADCAEQVEDPPIFGGGEGYSGIVESHPYATAVGADGTRYVADAAGNTVLKVTRSNRVSTLAVLPPQEITVTAEMIEALNESIEQANEGAPPEEQLALIPDCVEGHVHAFEAVPTDVEIGPDGQLYVSTLPGGPEDPSLGARGSVYKVNPRTGRAVQVATGFLGATNLAVAPNGDIYVAELFGGKISKAGEDGPETVAEVPFPAAVEFAGGKLYATIDAFGFATPDGGSLVTITP